MAKSSSSNGEKVKSIPFNGDLYHVYHLNGTVTEVLVRFDNVGKAAVPIRWDELPRQLQQLIDDTINL